MTQQELTSLQIKFIQCIPVFPKLTKDIDHRSWNKGFFYAWNIVLNLINN